MSYELNQLIELKNEYQSGYPQWTGNIYSVRGIENLTGKAELLSIVNRAFPSRPFWVRSSLFQLLS